MTNPYRIRNSIRDLPTWPSREEILALGAELDERYDVDHGDVDLVRAAIARWGRPTPQPVAAGEVAELLRILNLEVEAFVAGESSLYWLRGSDLVRIAELLQHQHPQPVAVGKRPWERKGWCDAEGRCWIFMPDIGTDPSWRLTDPRDIGPYHTHCLPANALPTPEATNA